MLFSRIALPVALFATFTVITLPLSAQSIWVAPGSGNWSTGSNWSTGFAPNSSSDVIIDVPGSLSTVTVSSNASVNTLNSQERLFFSGGNFFTIANGGSTTELLTFFGSNFSFNVGGNFTASGPISLGNANVNASVQSGEVVNLSGLTGYAPSQSSFLPRLTVNGGGTFAATNMQSLSGHRGSSHVTLQSTTGSLLDVSGLTSILPGAVQFEASQGGVIDMRQLGTYHNSNTQRDGGFDVSGGMINASGMTSLTSSFDVFRGTQMEVQVDGATSSINFSSLATLRNTAIKLTNGGSLDVSNVSDFNYSSIDIAGTGSMLDLSGSTAWNNGTFGNQAYARSWKVDGQSTLNASGLTAITTTNLIGAPSLTISADNGGIVDLSSTETLVGKAGIEAKNNGLVDLSSLQHLDGGSLDADSGGEIRLGNGSSGLTLNNATVSLRTGGIINTDRIDTMTGNSVIESFGVNRVLNVNQLDSSSIRVYDGGHVSLPQLAGALTAGGSGSTIQLLSEGTGSSLTLDNITTLSTSVGSGQSTISVTARDGGTIGMQQVQTIGIPNGLAASRPVNILAEGSGSIVDLDGLTSFADLAALPQSSITARDGGFIVMGSHATAQLTNIDVLVENGGTIQTDTIELLSQLTPGVFGNDDFSTLTGDGLIDGHLINTSGIVTPGSSLSALVIGGDFVQGINGDLYIDIDSATGFSRMDVTGDALWAGDLLVNLSESYDLQAGQDFLVANVSGATTGMFEGLGQGAILLSDNGFDLRLNYFGGDGNDLSLFTTSAIPEPATGLLLAGVTVGMLSRRRRAART